MKFIKYRQKTKPSLMRRGELWRPIDAENHDVVICDVVGDVVYLQYADSLDVAFSMTVRDFKTNYRWHQRATKKLLDQALPSRFWAAAH